MQQQQYEVTRKRLYRVGLNLFNKQPPERGIQFLIQNGFIDYVGPSSTPTGSVSSTIQFSEQQELLAASVAHFLLTRKGLSKKMIGEYIGNLQNPFNQLVLDHMVKEIELTGLPVDAALRKYQTTFRFPGEAQKIERLVEVFSFRYLECNGAALPQVRADVANNSPMSRDDVFILAFAIIMLNTDLHVPNNKSRMTLAQWIKNLRNVFKGGDLSESYLTEIYERVKSNELKTGPDHVIQVLKVQQTLVPGNTDQTSQLPNLCLPHRRLVCYCRLYEVYDISRKERQGQHQREIFLFNDLLLVTKIYKKNVSNAQSAQPSCLYSYRGSYPLTGLSVILFEAPHYPFGIRLQRRSDDLTITLNARNGHDRTMFVEDLKESIEEMNQMEQIRMRMRRASSGSGLSFESHNQTNGHEPSGTKPSIENSQTLGSGNCMAKSKSLYDLSANAVVDQRRAPIPIKNGDASNGKAIRQQLPTVVVSPNGPVPTVIVGIGRQMSNGCIDPRLEIFNLSSDNSPNNNNLHNNQVQYDYVMSFCKKSSETHNL